MSQGVLNGAAVIAELPVSIEDRERFIPPHYKQDDERAPVYILAPLSLRERRTLNRMVIGLCGMFVSTTELREALREAAVTDWAPEQAAEVATTIDMIEQWEGASERDESVEKMLADYRERLGRWQNDLSRLPGGARIRQLFETQLEQLETLSSLGIRMCIQDWEHLRVPCVRTRGLVTEEAMRAVPDADYEALNVRCLALREVTPDQELDSASP
jgi:hypothetical protein